LREIILLFSGFFLLGGSTNLYAFVPRSVSYSQQDASIQEEIIDSDEQVHASTTETIRRRYLAVLKRRQERFASRKAASPSPRVATLNPVVDKSDIHLKHRQIADQVLRMMPKQCVSTLKNFYVRYNDPEHRGLGGKTTIILTGTVSDAEFRSLFVHEFGHLTDLGCLNGSSNSDTTSYFDNKEQIWQNDPSVSFYQISWIDSKTHKRGIQPDDFVSGYASWDMFEDFAESFIYYVLHREVFAARAMENPIIAAKYRWFQQNLPNMPKVATSNEQWDGVVPWDITKLSYQWHPPANSIARR